jgi:hypothetical protein
VALGGAPCRIRYRVAVKHAAAVCTRQKISQRSSQWYPDPPILSTANFPAKPQIPPNTTTRMVAGIAWLLLATLLRSNDAATTEMIPSPKNIRLATVTSHANMCSFEVIWLSELITLLNPGTYELLGSCKK